MEMLFLRDFQRFQGGHLKLSDYIEHTKASGLAQPVLYQTPQSRAIAGNIFNALDVPAVSDLRPYPAYFLAGRDWLMLDRAGIDVSEAPVINLIQSFRHIEPAHPLYRFLKRPALRICVSEPLAEAVRGIANGEVHAIENGIAPVGDHGPAAEPLRILIGGLKNPAAARAVAQMLQGQAVIDLLIEPEPRADYLKRLASATICVLLPGAGEGFYLPALEAMALGRSVVVPDCGGNRDYCQDGVNCLMPDYSVDAIAAAAQELAHDKRLRDRLVSGGLATASRHSLQRERSQYHSVLARYLAHFPA